MRIVGLVLVWVTVGAAQVRQPTEAEQAGIQATVHRLVTSLNDRKFEGIAASTVPQFDVGMPGMPLDRRQLQAMVERPPEEYRQGELATLVRSMRMLTPDVAFGDGFFRTVRLAGGESAGRISITLVKQEGKWLVATARFVPYRFDNGSVFAAEASPTRTPAGADGWVTLFDGKSMDGFVAPGGGTLPESWTIEDGALKAVRRPVRSGIRTKDTFGSFELRFSWKVPAKGNSGVKYRLFYLSRTDGAGHEYQIADDTGDPGAMQHPVERSGALYNQIAPSKNVVRPAGEFNDTVIVVRGRHCEHWLNGEKVVEYETESGSIEGPILFQHHGTEAWYRNIRIRRLDEK
jgi:hypothetical protein